MLLLEFCRLVLSDCSIEGDESVEQIKEFINNNFPFGYEMIEAVTALSENQSKVKVGPRWANLEGDVVNRESAIRHVHYNHVCRMLIDLLKKIDCRSSYYLLVDELDEGFKSRDANHRLVILALLRACEDLAIEFSNSNIKLFPIVALRSDIFNFLEDNDLNKLDDYILELQWTATEDNSRSLKRIAQSRIDHAYRTVIKDEQTDIDSDKLWEMVFGSDEELWRSITILTFDRPRDLIKLLKYCQEELMEENQLTKEVLNRAEARFSKWLFNEFRDEVQSFLPCWNEVLNCLIEIGNGKEQRKVLEDKFKNEPRIAKWLNDESKDPRFITKLLFSYSVIGCVNNKRWIFQYKDPNIEYMNSYETYCVHYGFSKALRLPKKYQKELAQALSSVQTTEGE